MQSSSSPRSGRARSTRKRATPQVLFVCGSLNQTTQMLAVGRELNGVEPHFTPYYGDDGVELLRRAGMIEFTIAGNKARERCLGLLYEHRVDVDWRARARKYDLVVTCSDLVVPRNARESRLVAVQEGMLDPAPPLITSLVKRYRFLPRWLAGTAAAGLSGLYDRFCAASEGFRDLLVKNGAPAERVVVTGMPNYDDCQRFRDNRFPHHGYVLVCTSDARETKKRDDRQAFLRGVLAIAQGRPLIFKLHPNENVERATREIRQAAPSAMIVASGNVEEMIANCDEFITQYSSTAFVALALGKPVYSYYDAALLRRLLPDQNRSAAKNIASVCEEVLESEPAPKAVTEEPARSSSPPRR